MFTPARDILLETPWKYFFSHSNMTLTLHVTVILWNNTDLKVIIALARKWNIFDVNPGFSCQAVEFVLQFPMIYCIRVVEVVEWPLKREYDRLISDSWACVFHHAFHLHVTVPYYLR
jgi:NADH:ubiquinone oxidoreductase subunit B-like Fe-S oxidoreductase